MTFIFNVKLFRVDWNVFVGPVFLCSAFFCEDYVLSVTPHSVLPSSFPFFFCLLFLYFLFSQPSPLCLHYLRIGSGDFSQLTR